MTADTATAPAAAPPHSLEAEQSVLGGILLSDRAMFGLVVEEGLQPEHFYRERHQLIFEAMVALYEDTQPIDVLTVAERLRSRPSNGEGSASALDDVGGRAGIDELTGGVPGLGAIRGYAQIVIGHWRWRVRLSAAYEQQAVILNHGTEDEFEAALAKAHAVTAAHRVTDGYLGKDTLADHIMRWLEQPADGGLPLPVELPTLQRKMRVWPGHLTVVAAWPSGGKSSGAIQIAAPIGHAGHRVVIWSNEDSEVDHVAKHVQQATGVPSWVILERRVSDARMPQVLEAIGRLPFEVQPCHGWTAQQVAAHIQQVRPDVAIVDHFHKLSQIGKVAEIDEAINALASAAGRAACHVILCAQLNRARRTGVCKPPPVLGDLRGSAMFEAAAQTILLVHRDEEEIEDAAGRKTGKAMPLDTGTVEIAKNKVNGRTGVIRVRFDAKRLRFVEGAVDDAAVEPEPVQEEWGF